jgi:hypothetical protein
MKKINYNGDVPDHVLDRISEHSSGGFILLTLDAEGQPRFKYQFDNLPSAITMQYFMDKFLTFLDEQQSGKVQPEREGQEPPEELES